jgi:hypothetical protein
VRPAAVTPGGVRLVPDAASYFSTDARSTKLDNLNHYQTGNNGDCSDRGDERLGCRRFSFGGSLSNLILNIQKEAWRRQRRYNVEKSQG